MAGIGVDRNEKIGLFLVSHGGSGFKRGEGVILAREYKIGTQAGLQKFTEAQGHVQDNVFLFNAIGADGPGIMPAMAGIDDDASNLQSKRAYQRAVTSHSGLG